MPDLPNWTDKLSAWSTLASAIFALISMVALVVIAMAAGRLEEEIRDLEFPVPEPKFALGPISVSRPFPGNMTFRDSGEIALLVSGFSRDPIVIQEVEVERILGIKPSEFAAEIDLSLEHEFPVSPKANGLVDESIPLTYTATIRPVGIDVSRWESLIPLELGLEFRVVWFESETLRRHEALERSDGVYTIIE